MGKKPMSCKLGKHEWEGAGPKYATSDGYAIDEKCMKCGERRTTKVESEEKEKR